VNTHARHLFFYSIPKITRRIHRYTADGPNVGYNNIIERQRGVSTDSLHVRYHKECELSHGQADIQGLQVCRPTCIRIIRVYACVTLFCYYNIFLFDY